MIKSFRVFDNLPVLIVTQVVLVYAQFFYEEV